MQNPFATPTASNLGFLAARATLGAYFAIAGYSKIIASGGVPEFAKKNIDKVPEWFGPHLGNLYLVLLPPTEVVVGVALVIGFFTRTAALLAAAMLASFIYAVTGYQSANLPFHPNIIFLGLALCLLTNGGGTFTLPNILGKKGGAKPAGPPAK